LACDVCCGTNATSGCVSGKTRDWRKLCRQRVAEEVAKLAGTPAGEHWKAVLSVTDSVAGAHYRAKMSRRVEAFLADGLALEGETA
jgi:hypothetical protein